MPEIVKYLPFQSTAEPSFWMKLGEFKLNSLKLSEEPVEITASYGVTSTITHRNIEVVQTTVPGRMRLDQDSIRTSLDETAPNVSSSSVSFNTQNDSVHVRGRILILNTIESFKTMDKNELLNQHGLDPLMRACGVNMDSEDETTVSMEDEDVMLCQTLNQFFCLCHLDLKQHKVVYWFAFPALVPMTGRSICYKHGDHLQVPLDQLWNANEMESFQRAVYDFRIEMLDRVMGHIPFFMLLLVHTDGDHSFRCLPLSKKNFDALSVGEKSNVSFVFLDPTSSLENTGTTTLPIGWTLRNLIAYLTLKLKITGVVNIISFRPSVTRRLDRSNMSPFVKDDYDSSLMLYIQLPEPQDYIWPIKDGSKTPPYNCMGWELNTRGKPGPRSVNLAPLLSPAHLAKQATDLNLKLMKWRMIPNLDLNLLSNMNVLLLGAGTLGCSVSRILLGWGVRKFHFVDNGKVSYSNPVRQNLFEVSDCENGGKRKAVAAAEALKRIAGPSIESEGHVMTIPMPGHSFGPNEEVTARKDVKEIDALVQQADVVFLLTDTRESRWLPTVMARAHNKMLINAALGLDSWLVMRHGGNDDARLGCYFCNDVCAPENSTNNRTLDQQCTVTRPGLAPIASSMAVELMVALLHHEAKQNAPAPAPNTTTTQTFSPIVQSSEATSALGIMPHQIRGSIVTYTMMTPTVPAFKFCTGCCDAIVQTYKSEGFDFVKKVCSSDGSFLEDIAGITAFREEATSKLDDLEWDEDDIQDDDTTL